MEKIDMNLKNVTDEERKVLLETARDLKGYLECLHKGTLHLRRAIDKVENLPYPSLKEGLSEVASHANDEYLKCEEAWRVLLSAGHNGII